MNKKRSYDSNKCKRVQNGPNQVFGYGKEWGDIILKIKQKERFKLVLLTEHDAVIEKRDFIRNNPF